MLNYSTLLEAKISTKSKADSEGKVWETLVGKHLNNGAFPEDHREKGKSPEQVHNKHATALFGKNYQKHPTYMKMHAAAKEAANQISSKVGKTNRVAWTSQEADHEAETGVKDRLSKADLIVTKGAKKTALSLKHGKAGKPTNYGNPGVKSIESHSGVSVSPHTSAHYKFMQKHGIANLSHEEYKTHPKKELIDASNDHMMKGIAKDYAHGLANKLHHSDQNKQDENIKNHIKRTIGAMGHTRGGNEAAGKTHLQHIVVKSQKDKQGNYTHSAMDSQQHADNYLSHFHNLHIETAPHEEGKPGKKSVAIYGIHKATGKKMKIHDQSFYSGGRNHTLAVRGAVRLSAEHKVDATKPYNSTVNEAKETPLQRAARAPDAGVQKPKLVDRLKSKLKDKLGIKEDFLDEKCWDGYKRVPGTKKNAPGSCEKIKEEKDACYHKVKSRYRVWPSAYASGALSKCRKVGAKNWGTKSEETEQVDEKWSKKYKDSIDCSHPKGFSQRAHCQGEKKVNEDLRKWFRERWVRFGPDGRVRGDCARGSEGEGKPKCLPAAKAASLGKEGRAAAARRKRREDPNPNRSGKAILVKTVKEETITEALDYHMENKIPFSENIFRPGSDSFFELLREAKILYQQGHYTPVDDFEKDLFESDIGEFAEFEGQLVPLDFPFEIDEEVEDSETHDKCGTPDCCGQCSGEQIDEASDLRCPKCGENHGKDRENPVDKTCSTCGHKFKNIYGYKSETDNDAEAQAWLKKFKESAPVVSLDDIPANKPKPTEDRATKRAAAARRAAQKFGKQASFNDALHTFAKGVATDKLKEEVEQIDEVSADKLRRYMKKAYNQKRVLPSLIRTTEIERDRADKLAAKHSPGGELKPGEARNLTTQKNAQAKSTQASKSLQVFDKMLRTRTSGIERAKALRLKAVTKARAERLGESEQVDEGLKQVIKNVRDYFDKKIPKGNTPSSIERRQHAARPPEQGKMSDQLGEADLSSHWTKRAKKFQADASASQAAGDNVTAARKSTAATRVFDKISQRHMAATRKNLEDMRRMRAGENVTEEDKTNGHGIGKPFRKNGGGAVYVRSGDGVRLVNFSQSGMTKKFDNPGALKSFMARHHCLTNTDKTSASYWACRWPRFFSSSGKKWW